MTNLERYRVEWLACQNIPDGEDYIPDIHDHYDSVTLVSSSSAMRLAKLKAKHTGWAKVTLETREPDYFNGRNIGFWQEVETIATLDDLV